MRKLIGVNAADRWSTLIPRHLDSLGMVAEVVEVQTKLPVLFGANEVAKFVDESWCHIEATAGVKFINDKNICSRDLIDHLAPKMTNRYMHLLNS